ncbi:hypothetical protein ACHAW5_001726 [Stephanodiscus triporus]|uniref:Chitin-binding type-1 domain-containing protein n=1 Tax=Stephanodiscus triporus TaxID=2934178 RepID=A0ABD3QU83_9STRA
MTYSYLSLCSCIILLNLPPLISSQSELSNVTPVLCVGSPCLYKGECRDKFGECGVTSSHCDAESQWVPACGGGGDLDKPTAMETTATIAPLATSSSEPIEPSQVEQPTLSPITAWEEWNSDQAVPGLTTGQEVGSDAPSNETVTDWFDPNEWDDGKNQTADNEDVSMLDRIEETVFGSGAAAEGASYLLRMLAVLAWVAVL